MKTLSGPWRFADDPADAGVVQRWFSKPPSSCLDAPLPCGGATPVWWAFCSASLPDTPSDARCQLEVLASDCDPEVWVNGVRLDAAPGADHPGTFALDRAALENPVQIALRLVAQASDARLLHVAWSSMPAGGIERLVIIPDPRRKRITIRVDAPETARCNIRIGGAQAVANVAPGKIVVDCPGIREWTPQSPALESVTCELTRDAVTIDAVSVRAGNRDFSVRDGRFLLNNRACSLRIAALDAPGSMTADVLAALVRAGFNTVWTRRAADVVLHADWADEHGLMFIVVLSRNTVHQACIVSRLRNNASVIAWAMDDDASANGQALRELDPSRPILLIAPSGMSTVVSPWRERIEPIQIVRMPVPTPSPPDLHRLCWKMGAPGVACIALASARFELAGDGFTEGYAARQLDDVFESVNSFRQEWNGLLAASVRSVMNAFRGNASLTAIGVEFGCDVTPLAGKFAETLTPLYPAIDIESTTLTPREEVNLDVLLANDTREEGQAELSLQVQGPTSQVLWKKKRGITVPKAAKEIWKGDVGASGSTGVHRFVARIGRVGKVIAANHVEFFAYDPPAPSDVAIHVVGDNAAAAEACYALARRSGPAAPVHVLLPAGGTVFAYPDEAFLRTLNHVRDGAVAIVFAPPVDFGLLGERIDGVPPLTTVAAAGPGIAAAHYARFHPVFDSLPARGLMRQPYRDVIPMNASADSGDEDVSGCVIERATPTARTIEWGSNIVVRRYGDGRLVFVYFRIVEHLPRNPVAARLFVNILNHFRRRAVPSGAAPEADHKALEWFRDQRAQRCRRWLLAGFFPNIADEGHETEYPPERGVNASGGYMGRHATVSWTPANSFMENEHRLDVGAALDPLCGECDPDWGTAYAYAEFTTERRQPVSATVATSADVKLWMNGRVFLDSRESKTETPNPTHVIDAYVRQGRNTVLVKLSKRPGPCTFRFALEPAPKDHLSIKWWK